MKKIFTITAYCLLVIAYCQAQWSSNPAVNNAICTATAHQASPQLISDGAGGAIITWDDSRPGNSNIYAQRINANGTVQWTGNGVAICSATGGQSGPQLISDGAGGAIIIWGDGRNGNGDIYAQRINSSGVGQWTANGVAVCTAVGSQLDYQLISDGAGGAIITLRDWRNIDYDIYAQRVNSSGVAQWTANGVAICTETDDQTHPQLTSDGAGGAIITWDDFRNGSNHDIYAQRLNSSGVAQWTANGVGISIVTSSQVVPQLISDGAGGALITWYDSRSGNGNYDIYAQRINSSGVGQWTANGVAVCTETGTQNYPQLISDGAGGAIFTWEDRRSGTNDIYTQRVNSSGVSQWTANGVPVCTATNIQEFHQLTSDGAGGALITWQDRRSGVFDIYAQHVNASGAGQWTANGVAVCTEPSHQLYPQLISDGAGGAFIIWFDTRSGIGDISAQNVCLDGTLGSCISVTAPTITSFTPTSGPVGTLVTITGTNLSSPTAFTIGGVSAIAVSNTGTTLVGMIMPGAVTGAVSVTTANDTATSAGNFTVTPTPFPGLQQGSKLVGTGNTGAAQQGYSVAVSADGNTAIVGGYSDNSNQGASWIYIRSGGVWTQQGTKLVGTGAVGAAYQGISVSLSADGNTAMVGGYRDNAQTGAVWIFVRSGGVWSQQGSKLVGTGAVGAAWQGSCVSLSADGNTAVVGGYQDNSDIGAVWVYSRSGGVWAQQGTKLVGTGAIGAAQQGVSLALSADGNNLLIGGYLDNSTAGAVWVYTRSGGVWSQQGSKLVGTGAIAANQGRSVALSADGNTAMVGGYSDNTGVGAAWVYTRSGNTWTQQGSKLVGTGAIGGSRQGSSVCLSADGNTALVGADSDNGNVGATWVYTRSGGIWTQQASKLVGTGNSAASRQGAGVAVSATGNTAIIGGYTDNSNKGAAWVFIPIGPKVWTGAVHYAGFAPHVGNWNEPSNWSTGTVPTATDDVIIPAGAPRNPIITDPVTVNKITLEPGNSSLGITWNNPPLTLGSLTVIDSVINDGFMVMVGDLQSGFLQSDTCVYIGGGFFRVQLGNTSFNTADGYRNISSPVQGATVADIATHVNVFGQDGVNCWYDYSPYPNVQVYDEALSIVNGNYYEGWKSYTGGGNSLNAMKGLAVRTYGQEHTNLYLEGAPNNGAKSVNITKTTSATPSQDGWNLIGNPYPSTILWSAVTALNPGETDASYYVFHTTGEYTGNWGSHNGTTGTNGATNEIANMQGFFVKATGNHTFNMNNSVRSTGQSIYFRTGTLPNELRLKLSNNSNSDEIVCYTDPTATVGFDAAHDAVKMAAGSTVYLSFQQDSQEYAINVIDSVHLQSQFPLVLWARDTGSYSLKATALNLTSLTAYFKDSLTGTLTNLTTDSVMVYLSGGETYENRYSVVFQSNTATAIAPVTEPVTRIYSNGNRVFIQRTSTEPATISIMNVLGQQLAQVTSYQGRTEIPLQGSELWYAFVKVTEGNKVSVAKVLISHK